MFCFFFSCWCLPFVFFVHSISFCPSSSYSCLTTFPRICGFSIIASACILGPLLCMSASLSICSCIWLFGLPLCLPLSRSVCVFVLPCVASLFVSRLSPFLCVVSYTLAIFFAGALLVCFVFLDMFSSSMVACCLFGLVMVMCAVVPGHDLTS